ncbi:MAG: hypothetical protein U0793_11800 [Gemmataceae bacterium]
MARWLSRLGTRRRLGLAIGLVAAVLACQPFFLSSSRGQVVLAPPKTGTPTLPAPTRDLTLLTQPKELADAKSVSCVACHQNVGDPHFAHSKSRPLFYLGCVDCHGGDPSSTDKHKAHVSPRFPDAWRSSANPARSYALLNHETPEFIRFVNPGDLRVAQQTCGTCHPKEVEDNRGSMMTHGCMLWGAALYNNGGFPLKRARFGEAYTTNGVPARIQTFPPPTPEQTTMKGIVPYLDPLPRFEISQPGNILRFFERGGRFRPEIGIPEREEESGRPRARLSTRGLGTENRTDPVFVGLARTRLLDPTLNFLGTNDHPGDYRSSGCTACHTVYANDRSPVHSGPYAKYGHLGTPSNPDPTIPPGERGHPIDHSFTRAIPTSQCMVCHVHPGTNVMNSYLGYMWWDEETDAEFMYPARQKNPTAEEFVRCAMNNPDEASARGLWSDPAFLDKVYDLNPALRHTQFADFHGHGWVFRAVFKKDRAGHYLDQAGKTIDAPVSGKELKEAVDITPKIQDEIRVKVKKGELDHKCTVDRDGKPVHLMDIHLEKGMHCIDCHFVQDVHGNGKLYQEVRAAIEIQCVDCHGTIGKHATLRTSGPASTTDPVSFPLPEDYEGKTRDLTTMRTPFGKRRFERKTDAAGRPVVVQNSMVEPYLSWIVKQTRDVITPGHPDYNERAEMAKTAHFASKDAKDFTWGLASVKDAKGGIKEEVCAHSHKNMSCIACHSAWNPSCFGCHLPQRANKKMPALHNEGDVQRNYVAYNFQTLRDDVYMLARDGDVTGNRINPARSSCAIHVGSYNQNRDSIYSQQQTISSDGLSGLAFSTNVPHTVRGGPPRDKAGNIIWDHVKHAGRSETKSCTDCHLSAKGDNNAILAQLTMQGTGYTNFMGRYCWVAAGEHGLFGVVVTEQDEPQTVIGSSLHRLAFPDCFKKHVERGFRLKDAHEHPGIDIKDKLRHPRAKAEILAVQNRGEYLYAACGHDGVRVFDIAMIDNKSFSERITTAPVAPRGQNFHVPTRYAVSLAAPCTPAPDPTRQQIPENKEPKVHALFGYLYVADKYEGLILIGAGTTIDGNPLNNFLEREVTFNPKGVLNGARGVTIVGHYAYMLADAGLVVVDIDHPKEPRITSIVELHDPHAIQVQFRYAFACDHDGVKVLDVTDLARPRPVTTVKLEEAHSIYLARTYAYVAAGKQGLVILDIEKPAEPKIDQVYNCGGRMCDVHDVKLGITYVSEFAYVADGKNGLRVLQLTSPETPGNMGFSPRPAPRLIATFPIPEGGHALAVARALDRDRAVDESGNQIGVFGRIGARPLSLAEQQQLYLRGGRLWTVTDDPADWRHLRK